eukprot:15452093-Alexandrium_andersonii.AAC.1
MPASPAPPLPPAAAAAAAPELPPVPSKAMPAGLRRVLAERPGEATAPPPGPVLPVTAFDARAKE